MWFTATVPEGTYFAIGFGGTSMKHEGMIFMSGKKDDPYTKGLFSTSIPNKPSDDNTQEFKQENFVQLPDSSYNFTISRKLNTGNSKNLLIEVNKTFSVDWASNSKSSDLVFHDKAGQASLILNSNGGDTPAPEEEGFDVYKFHGWMLWAAWFALGFIQVLFGRWFPYATTYTGYIHAAVGTIVLVLTLYAVGVLAIHRDTGIELDVQHEKAGWAVVFILIFFTVTGIMAFLSKTIFKWNSKPIRIFRWVHRIVAYAMYGLCVFTLYTGLRDHIRYLDPDGALGYQKWIWINLYGQIGIVILFEIMYRINKSMDTAFVTPHLEEVIDEETFEKRVLKGEKLVLLDDMVLDIGSFAYHHPGGAFLLDYNVGRDVSKFFYGSYALDGNNSKPGMPNERHAHSNIARKWANKLAVAALVRKNTQSNTFKIDVNQTVNINGFTKTFAFVSTGSKGLPGVKNWYSNLSELGKCYTISAQGQNGTQPYKDGIMGNVMRRHYTITNCLQMKFYAELLKVIAPYVPASNELAQSTLTTDSGNVGLNKTTVSTDLDISGQEIELQNTSTRGNDASGDQEQQQNKLEYSGGQINADIFDTRETNQINMTIKNYNLPGGISQQVFDPVKQMFNVVGPMGKGLGLSEKSEGVFMIYCAGTGILPFMDLIVKVLLQELKVLPITDEKLHDNFQLHLYAGFQSREDAIALPVIESIVKICQKNGHENRFKFFPRFSNLKPPRWNYKFIDEQLQKHAKVERIWVCGPPLLEEQFDKDLYELAPKYKMHFSTQVDIM